MSGGRQDWQLRCHPGAPQEGLLRPPRLHGVGGEVLVLGGGAGAPGQLRVGGVTGQQQGKAWAEREGQGLSPEGENGGG